MDTSDPRAVRRAIRDGSFTDFTNRVAPGYVQGNLVILPARWAADFRAYCERNPRPLPLFGMSEPGCPAIPALAEDLDLTTDVGEYRIYRDGVFAGTARDIRDLWQDDMVAFVLGCSFSFEAALLQAGVPLRHIAEGSVSPMYVTSIPTEPAGPFGGPLLVSMRCLRPADAIRAVQVTSRYPRFHGAPIHLGLPGMIGVDLDRPYGGHGLTRPNPDELPVFWACGATGQLALEAARLPLAITHSKAHMVLTDLEAERFADA